MLTRTAESPDRLDAFLAKGGPFASRAKAQAAIEAGGVTVNGVVLTNAAKRLKPGDVVAVASATMPEDRRRTEIESANLRLSVLYEDEACLVLNKPAGLSVHPGAGMSEDEKTILHGIAHLFQERSLPFSSATVLVHRLDKDTTGCLLVAKTPDAHRALQKQFEARTVRKTYLAIVAGIPSHASAIIDAPIGRSPIDRTKMSVIGGGKRRGASTTYRTLAAARDAALLECDIHTGRTHQIRVHLSSIGHPVLGDETYGTPLSHRVSEAHRIPSLCLHAWTLAFQSPASEKERMVEADPAQGFRYAIDELGLKMSEESSAAESLS